jgi:small multidrug resistance pump
MQRSSVWMKRVLFAAGIYNLAWGTWVVFFPTISFEYSGLMKDGVPPNYPQLWQCIGMIVGVYGIGYLAAARDPIRHWPIILVGFLGKVFGPLGYVWGLIQGQAQPEAFVTHIFNDLIWLVPFALILRSAWIAEKATMQETRSL